MLSGRIRLEPFDDYFHGLGRVAGTLIHRVSAENGADDWYVLHLDEPLGLSGGLHTHFLIRSRWADHAVGGPNPTSAFLVRITDPAVLEGAPARIDTSDVLAWVTAITEHDNLTSA